MNYRDLLMKYMDYISHEEGTTYVEEHRSAPASLTAEEWAALREIDDGFEQRTQQRQTERLAVCARDGHLWVKQRDYPGNNPPFVQAYRCSRCATIERQRDATSTRPLG